MMTTDFHRYVIRDTATIREALDHLESNAGDILVLLVVDRQEHLVGTLTDGDARRGLLSGCVLSQTVSMIMHRQYYSLKKDDNIVMNLKVIRSKGIELIPVIDAECRICSVVNLRKQKSKLPIDAVIMAGGKGERLRPLTESIPKPLLPIGNKAIIDYNVDRLISYGVEHISITVNYLKEQLEEHYSESRNGVIVHCVSEPEFMGTMGAVQYVEQFYNDTILVMNSDLFTDIDFEDFYLHFLENDADMSIAAIPYNVSIPLGIFELDGRNIQGVLEKPVYNYYANAGIYLIKKSVLNEIPRNERFDATDLINKLIAKHKSVIRYPLNGTWIDIGTKEEYQKAQDLAKHLKRM